LLYIGVNMVNETNPLDAFERDFKKGIGLEVDLNSQRFVVEAARDSIKNFADAVGDANPLWINEEYAKKSRFKGITAPPNFLINVNHGSAPSIAPLGKPPPMDLGLLYTGAELEFYRTIRLGDVFTIKGKSTGIVRKESKSLGPMLFATGEVYYYNQRQELIGIIRATTCRFLPPKQQAIHIARDLKPGIEVKSPDLLAFERKRRGPEPRYWEDVAVGEEMTPMLEKGLLTMTEIMRFGLYVSPIPRRIEQKRKKVEIGFAREEAQKRNGLEDASDYGPQRVCWLGQFCTDWMGDDGTLKKYSCQMRHPNIIGDSNFVKGKVKAKRIENSEHLVDCEIWVENQAGLITAPGLATVALPVKKG
jgi:acyl dehydratase